MQRTYILLKQISKDLQVDADLVDIQLFDETNERLGSLARFTTCAMATNEYCYFQNDKWRNLHLDSLYLNFARYPNLVHATAPPATYLDQLRWRMTNPGMSGIDMVSRKDLTRLIRL